MDLFHREQVVCLRVLKLLGDSRLTARNLDRHQCDLQTEHFQQRGNGGDLVTLSLDVELAEQ